MIQIINYSFISIYLKYLLIYFFRRKKRLHKIIVIRQNKLNKSPTQLYFIIKTPFLSEEALLRQVKKIREQSDRAHIIVIGKNLPYEMFFKHHCRIFGIVDTSQYHRLTSIKNQVHFYLEGIYD